MLVRDPVHGLIDFEGEADRVITALLDTREVQRLRRVRQLGLTSLVFPGAEHSRFAHALGAAHVMTRLLARIRVCQAQLLPADLRVDAEAERDAVAAAFLHDLGHGPLSHLFEEVLPGARHHEEWTHDAVMDPSTDVHRTLAAMDANMPARVAALLTGKHRLSYLGRAISGTLDVDRCDYLLRDSHMTGVRYGIFDLDWLLRALNFGQISGGEWVLAIEGRKGLPPIEGFFLARHFMYQQVYHHKATRAAESIIRSIFVRLAELVRDGKPPSHTPAALQAAARGERVSLADYLALDDASLLTSFAAWSAHEDSTLSALCDKLNRRALPKTVPLPEGPDARRQWTEAHARASDVVSRHGARADLLVWLDVPSDVPYEEPHDDSPEGLWVLRRHHTPSRLGDISFVLGELRNKRIERPRLVIPTEWRDEILAAIEPVIT